MSFSTHSNLFSSNGDVFTSGCSYVQKRLASHLHHSICNSDDRGKALNLEFVAASATHLVKLMDFTHMVMGVRDTPSLRVQLIDLNHL